MAQNTDFQNILPEKNLTKTYYPAPELYQDFFTICKRKRSSCNAEILNFIEEFNRKNKKFLTKK